MTGHSATDESSQAGQSTAQKHQCPRLRNRALLRRNSVWRNADQEELLRAIVRHWHVHNELHGVSTGEARQVDVFSR